MWAQRRRTQVMAPGAAGAPPRAQARRRLARRRWRFARACIRFIVMLQVRARHGVKLSTDEITALETAYRHVSQGGMITDAASAGRLLELLGLPKSTEQMAQLLAMVNHEDGQLLRLSQAQKILHRLKQNHVLTQSTDAEDAFVAIGGGGGGGDDGESGGIPVTRIAAAVAPFGLSEPIPSGPRPFHEPASDGGAEPEPFRVSFYEFAALVGEAPAPSIAAVARENLRAADVAIGGGSRPRWRARGGSGAPGVVRDGEGGEVGSSSNSGAGSDASDACTEPLNCRSPGAHRRSSTRSSRSSSAAGLSVRGSMPPSPLDQFLYKARRHLAPDAPRAGSRALKKKREAIVEQLQQLPRHGAWVHAAAPRGSRGGGGGDHVGLAIEFRERGALAGAPRHGETRSSVLRAAPLTLSSVGASPTCRRPASALERGRVSESAAARRPWASQPRPQSAAATNSRSGRSAHTQPALTGVISEPRRRAGALASSPSFALPAEQRAAIMLRSHMRGAPTRDTIRDLRLHRDTQQVAALVLAGLGAPLPAESTNECRSWSPHRRTVACGVQIRPSSSVGRSNGSTADNPADPVPPSFFYPVVGVA